MIMPHTEASPLSYPGTGAGAGHEPDVRATPAFVPMSDEVHRMELARMVHELFYRARDARRPLVNQWKKNYRVLNNRTWTPRAESWMPAPEVSNIWPLVASMVAWMTDQQTSISTTPSAPPFSEFAQYYNKLSEHLNAIINNNMMTYDGDAEIERMLWDVATYGVGYQKTGWEPWLADGLGDTMPRRINPFDLYPDPYARNTREANFFVEARIMSVEDLDRAFPGARQQINSAYGEDIDESPHRNDSSTYSRAPRINLAPLSPSTTSQYGESPRRSNIHTHEDPVVVVLEAWVRHHQIITAKDDPQLAEGTARVVDRWKCVVVCGNTVLMDKWADEIYGHNTHPYDKMTLFDTGEWFGPALVEFLTSPQESINRLLGSMEHNILLLGNPVFMQSPQFNRGGRQTITNRPGQRVEGSKDRDGWLSPPPLHPDTVNLIMYYESKLESISGLSAIMRGFSPTGRNSEDVMSSVQDSAFVRVRATLRNLNRCLRGAAFKMAANIAEFYTEPRTVAIVGPDGTDTALALKARHFYTLPDSDDQIAVPLRFSIRADAGADRPTSRQARMAEAQTFYALGAIDDMALLETAKFPNWPIVAERNMKLKAQQGILGQPPGARQRTRK